MINKDTEDWFKTWFNSPYYHRLYDKRNEKEASEFLDNILCNIQLDKDAHLLDLACGKGRHARYLNSKGFEVTGIDLSPENHSYNLTFESEKLHFKQWDMRHPVAKSKFDVVFNLFTSFGYFDNRTDNLAVVNAVHNALKVKGLLIIDYLNVNYVRQHIKETEIVTRMGINFSIKRTIDDCIITKLIDFEDAGRKWHFEENVQAFELKDFESLFAGKFEIIQTYGDYNLKPFNEDTGQRLILFARKI